MPRRRSWFLPSADRRLKPLGPALTTARRLLAAAAASSCDLELALEHEDFLVLFLEALQQLLDRDFLCLRGERQGECRENGGAQRVLVPM